MIRVSFDFDGRRYEAVRIGGVARVATAHLGSRRLGPWLLTIFYFLP